MSTNYKIETNNVRNVIVEWGQGKFVSVVEWAGRDGYDFTFDNMNFSLTKSQLFAMLQSTSRLSLEDAIQREPKP